eukprot:GILK01008366.1.p1 GENE.GILK01008366.1~~GILK01008366.1.p1  ORF type:complete len:222 (+),score=8.08 GILK01008366.1:44-709(+)
MAVADKGILFALIARNDDVIVENEVAGGKKARSIAHVVLDHLDAATRAESSMAPRTFRHDELLLHIYIVGSCIALCVTDLEFHLPACHAFLQTLLDRAKPHLTSDSEDHSNLQSILVSEMFSWGLVDKHIHDEEQPVNLNVKSNQHSTDSNSGLIQIVLLWAIMFGVMRVVHLLELVELSFSSVFVVLCIGIPSTFFLLQHHKRHTYSVPTSRRRRKSSSQ